MRQQLPGLQYNTLAESRLAGQIGVSVEGSNATVPGDDMYHTLSSNVLTMNTFDPYGTGSQWFEIFSTGTHATDYNIAANASFVNFTKTSGHILPDGSKDVRLYATFDWSKCPEGEGMVLVNISSVQDNATMFLEQTQYGTQYSMPQLVLPYHNVKAPANFTNGFVESGGYITIELEHYSSITSNSSEISYNVINHLSRTLSGITLFPVTASSQTAPKSPGLEYKLYTFTNLSQEFPTAAGHASMPVPVNITIVTTPSLNTDPGRPLKYAIQFDEDDIQTVQYVIDQPAGAEPVGWPTAVSDNSWQTTTNFTYSGPGEHTLRVWALEPGVVLNTAWIDLGGIVDSYLGPPESARIM